MVDTLIDHIVGGKALEEYRSFLEEYDVTGWEKYVQFGQTYTRTLVIRTEELDVYVISWRKGQKTQIHDHPEHGCLLKVLAGKLVETLYSRTDDDISPLVARQLTVGSVGYREGDLILHRIEAEEESVSLHIYSPPLFKTKYY